MTVTETLRPRLAVVALCLTALASATASPPVERDPLAAEIERWSVYVRETQSADEMWKQVKDSSGPAITRAAEALRDGRRLLARGEHRLVVLDLRANRIRQIQLPRTAVFGPVKPIRP